MIRVNLLPGAAPRRATGLSRFFTVPAEQRAALFGVTVLMATAVLVAGWWWTLDQERRQIDAVIGAQEATLVQLQEAAGFGVKLLMLKLDSLAMAWRLRSTSCASFSSGIVAVVCSNAASSVATSWRTAGRRLAVCVARATSASTATNRARRSSRLARSGESSTCHAAPNASADKPRQISACARGEY